MFKAALILVSAYLAIGFATNAFLFHLPVWQKSLDVNAERLRIALTLPPLQQLRRDRGDEAAVRAVAVGIVFLWPLFVIPLLRWMSGVNR